MARTPEALVNPALLIWARESIELSAEEAAAKARVTPERLAAWEAGTARPSIAQLRKLATVYKRPLAVFFLPEPPRGFQALRDFRRLPQSETGRLSPHLHAAIRRAHFQRDVTLELLQALGDDVPAAPQVDADASERDMYGSAMRKLLGVSLSEQRSWREPRHALAAWIEAVERAGVIVLHAQRIGLDEMRGFSVSAASLPVIALNGADTPRGRIFTILHELAHVLLSRTGVCDLHDRPAGGGAEDIEVVCNELAAATLLPKDSLLAAVEPEGVPSNGRWEDVRLAQLANDYSVSREVVLRRFLSLGLTSWEFVNEKRDEYRAAYEEARSRQTSGGPSPYTMKVRDLGRPYVELALEAFHRNEITASAVSEYLETKVNRLQRLEEELRRRPLVEA